MAKNKDNTNTKNNNKKTFTKTGDTLKTERTIYEKIVDEFGKDLKVIKSLAGGTGTSAHLNFRCYNRLAAQASQIANKCPIIDTVSQVHRAAHYLGINLLYHILMRDNWDFKGSQTYEAIIQTEDINYNYQLLDDCAKAFKELYISYKAGVVTKQKALDGIEEIIETLPQEIQLLARRASVKIFSGRPIREILYDKGPGRPGGKSEKNDEDVQKNTANK